MHTSANECGKNKADYTTDGQRDTHKKIKRDTKNGGKNKGDSNTEGFVFESFFV